MTSHANGGGFEIGFLFRGTATGIGGHIRTKKDVLFPTQGSVALPITGGLATQALEHVEISDEDIGQIVAADSVAVEVRGDYEPGAESRRPIS